MNIEEEMRRSYLAYSMSVIIGRALPDARDGLKPVHRRILTAMDREGLQHNKKYSKCAGVVGECLKKYHPHGDSAIYDALVRMAQPWSLRYPLVDGQGNFGSVDGDPPAAYRYTECRMERIAEEMLADIEMETVDLTANYDESTFEPTVLPTRIPNLDRERLQRHRGGHGHQHSAAQPDRSGQRGHRAGEESQRRTGRGAQARAGAGLPHRRFSLRQVRHCRRPTRPAAAAS